MKQIRLLAQYYVDLMVKLGLVRFSLLLASALVVLAMIVRWRSRWYCGAMSRVLTWCVRSSSGC